MSFATALRAYTAKRLEEMSQARGFEKQKDYLIQVWEAKGRELAQA